MGFVTGISDTPIEGVTDLDTTLREINWASDFSEVQTGRPGEILYTNTRTPIDQPETFRLAFSQIPNIYKGSSVAANRQLTGLTGVSLLFENRQTWKETASSNPAENFLAPIRVAISVQIPRVAGIDGADLFNAIRSCYSATFGQGLTDDVGAANALRGVLAKK